MSSSFDNSGKEFVSADVRAVAPLSFEQEGIWLASRFAAGPADFHNVSALRLEGELDTARLEAALTQVADRHQILRSVFLVDDTRLGQRVLATTPIRMTPVDAPPGTTAANWKSDAFHAFLMRLAEQPFDLSAAPPWRTYLTRIDAGVHVFVVVFHHILIDAIGSAIFLDDLTAFYRGDAALPPMAMQYADYAAADRTRGEQIAQDIEHWRQHLAGASRSLTLPPRAEPGTAPSRRGQRRFSIDANLTADLDRLARQNNSSLFGAMAAAFAVSLSRIGGDVDLVLHIIKSTRRRPEVERMIGVLVDTMLLRVDLAGPHTFASLLQQLRERLQWGFARPVPHSELVRALGGQTRGGHGGEIAINYHKVSTETPDIGGLRASHWRLAGGHSAYAMALEVYNEHGTLDCLIDYDATSISHATVERIVEGLDAFLRAALSTPLAPITSLPTITAVTMAARLCEQPRGAITWTHDSTVPALFAEQVRANPTGLAIRDHQGDWSAGAIDAQSSRVANLLRARGIQPGARVGICLPRSADFVIAALGVMKASAAYVPVDPAYPAERIRLILESAEPAGIISHADLTDRLPSGIAPLLLDRERDALAAQSPDCPPTTNTPDSPAYVLFTSGSTGRPRGVVGLHRGIVNRIAWMRRTHPFWNDEVCAQKTTIGFVDSIWEIFGPLTSGVPLVVLPDATVRDARALVTALTQHHITRVVLVPSLLEAILDAQVNFDTSLQRLRLCISSGEPLSPALAARCRARLPHVTLLNIYGSSEVAADVTWAEITDASIRDQVSIGRPIDNVHIYFLDRARQLVPRGETGEIYVGGAALAAGYVGDDAATAERFIPDPFAAIPGARLFKTGDLGRVRDDGEIEVLGRLDQQIKVLGRRVEPAEIEGALAAHPSIRQAAVVLNGERGILTAFVVSRSPDGIDRSALKEFLRRRLPDYMVPAVFITLATLPLSAHGKIDRAHLASIDIGDSGSPAIGGAPATPLEQQLTELWTEVLGVAPRSVDDDFVALGGHSLRATQLAWRIRERLGLELSPGAVFEHTTVRLLASEIARLAGTGRPDGLPPIVPVERGETATPSAAQRQFWLEERLHEGRGANQHGGTYVVTGPFAIAAFDRSLTALVARHESLRSIIRADGGELRMVVRPPEAHVSPVEDLSRVPAGDRLQRLEVRLASERRRPFALDAELPFRVRIYRLASDHHAISFSVHHSAFDGWSAAILMRELTALYRAERRGGEARLSELPIRYADFAEWQRACAEGTAFSAQRDYWRRQLAGAPESLELPFDRQPRAGTPPRMGRCAVLLDAGLVDQLRALGQAEGATTFMTLSAGFATLLARYSGQWDLVIGTAAANRRLPSTQSIIGAFVNTLALRFRLDRTSPFRDAVRVARTVTTEAFDHQDVPFDIVVADVAPQRHADRAPLFQALFAMQDRDGWRLELDDLEAEELETPPGVTAIPLSLVLHQHGATVRGFFEYRADLFDADTIDRLSANYLALLHDAVTSAATTLQSLQVVSHNELARLRQFEGAVAPERAWERLELTFARHADQTPDAPAVSTLNADVSYRDLKRRAQQIAARLIAMGVEPGHIVAIEVPRSVPLFVAILGVLQAGAAYVVIDHQQPAARRRFILEDSGAVVLISDGSASNAEDSLLLAPFGPLPRPADTERSANALACLVYTSGSSGEPKGVRITHRNVAAMSDAFGSRQGINAGSRVAQMVSPAFDVALSDIFATWLRGACLCILDPADSLPGKAMVSAFTRLGVTHWNVPPSLLAECPATPWPELATIAVGGEPPAHDVLARWHPARVISAYGLTEATVASTAEDFVLGRQPAIGAPLAGTHVAIVDDAGQPVPIGVPGQMVIAGPQVADGYHRRPALTAARFPPGPDGPRLQTGDRARWRADGRIEFLGRLDRQLKFHGYRIEPGEIEAAARSHAGIEQAFAVVRPHAGGDDRLVAYVVARHGHAVTVEALRAHLRTRLPSTMCPTDVVFVEAFPRTTTGKIDQRALPAPGSGMEAAETTRGAVGDTEAIIAAVWSDVLGHARFGRDDSFFDAGGHSLLAVRAHDRLAAHFGDALSVVDLFAHPTITALARHLEGRSTLRHSSIRMPHRSGQAATRAVAIIGMACRYPKSPDVDALWRNLVDGIECLTRFNSEELTAAGVDASTQSDPRFVPVAGVIDGVDQFDADFFGLSAADARLIDPQHRLLLELSQTALDTAGYDTRRYAGRIGIFAGVGFNTYLHEVLYPGGIPTTAEGFAAISANDKDFAASQVAYRLDLRGPAVTVQTACSTSLVAVDVAIQSLLSGRCDMALAGGVAIHLPQTSGYRHEEGMILSPDGHCRPFDASAAGTVGSNGGGVVLLKPLDEAIADGDQIEAVILGSASNNDGRRKVGFTAPGVDGQVQVIRAALEQAGVDPRTIQYVETHGTGTSLGDPIEIQALNDAYGRDGESRIAIGSIKSNLGHTDTAAGVAGLIKAALALKHNRIPRSLHFDTPNPQIDFGERLFVADRELPFSGSPRRAAVSAFGIGGTNAHVILEQPPALSDEAFESTNAEESNGPVATTTRESADQVPRILPISARSDMALREACANLAGALGNADAALDDIAYTLQRGRREYAYRHAVIAGSVPEARAGLEARSRGAGAFQAADHRRSVWLFSGQGSQQPGMARELYGSQPVVREWIDRAADTARAHLGLDLRDMLCGEDPGIHDTRYTQPALFAMQYALARAWQSFGVMPAALIGHSFGEYTAACLAGVFSFEDALLLVCERGRLAHECPAGSMLAVRLSEAELRPMIASEPIEIAAINAPGSCVVAGPGDAIARLSDRLSAAGCSIRLLLTDRAFHSSHIAAAGDAFERVVQRVRRSAPSIPIVSTLSGQWLTPEEAVDPARWRRQLCEPVRFADAVRTLESREPLTFLEIGPDSTLSTLVLQILEDQDRCITASQPSLDAAIGRLWAAGIDVDWASVGPPAGRRVALPSYPFQRTSHWGEATTTRADQRSAARPIDEWFSVPAWYRSAGTAPQSGSLGRSWLIVADEGQDDYGLARELQQRGGRISVAAPGPEAVASIRAARPSHVVFVSPSGEGDLERALDRGLHSLLDCVRAIGEHPADASLTLITQDVLDVTGSEPLDPSHAPSIGAMKVAQYEYPHIRCRHIDLSAVSVSTGLIDELCSTNQDASVAYRGGHRWLPGLAAVEIPQAAPPFREGGTYLLTGGFGGVALTLARYLGESFKANLALVGRRGAPANQEWTVARTAIEQAGGSVHTYAADVSDLDAMRRVIDDIHRQCGHIHGCVHTAAVMDRGGVIHRRDRASMDAAIRAKVFGTDVLSRLLRDDPLDFLVLCSTLGSLLPQAKFGQAGYSAANEYLDAFAASARRKGVPAIAINWDDWSGVGMSVAAAIEAAAEGRQYWTGHSLTPALGTEVFKRLAGSPHARVVVSIEPVETMQRGVAALFVGKSLSTTTVPADPGSALHDVWAEALGVQGISPDSNFFTLGGHSLIAIQVLTRVRELFNVKLPLAGFLDQPTLGQQTLALERALAKQAIASVTTMPSDTDEEWTL